MKINSEWELIDLIKDAAAPGGQPPADLIAGIGDDCAVFDVGRDTLGLITTDISIENRHFRKDLAPPDLLGRKIMTGNISDIAAMGGVPRFAFVSIGIPDDTDESYILSLYRGMKSVASVHGILIAGGDTSGSNELVVNVALYGEVSRDRLLLRSGARPGQGVYVTGTLGDSSAGLETILSGSDRKKFPSLVEKHLDPPCRIAMVSAIIDAFRPSSMIDISDGLLSDLRHICRASGTGFVIERERIPISPDMKEYSRLKKIDPLTIAMESGEEFELLFTATKKPGARLPDSIEGTVITEIGAITESDFLISDEGKTTDAEIKGFDHFKNTHAEKLT